MKNWKVLTFERKIYFDRDRQIELRKYYNEQTKRNLMFVPWRDL